MALNRRNVSMMRLGRCIAFLAAAAFLLPFTILLMVADQQYNLTYNSKRVFYQELSPEYILCTECFGLLENRVNVGEETFSTLPALGHRSICFPCGKSILRAQRTYPVHRNREESNILTRLVPLHLYIFKNGSHEEGLLTREKFMEVHSRMMMRRDYLMDECSRLGLTSSHQKANAWEYLINRQYHVIWCNIFKAASTSWMYNFNLMANYTAAFLDKAKEVPLVLARKKYARPTVEMIRKAQPDSISFLIVRHPLERLASAYNDKIIHAWPRSFHDNMGHMIVKKYRKKSIVKEPKYPLFEEFVSYVLDEAKTKRSLDMHWTPYTTFCTPCKFNFDVILKFETLEEDQKYLIQLARLQDVVKPEWKNSGKGANTLHNINHLYSRLNKAQLDGLHKLYKNDFQLFNYTIDNYYEIVKDDSNHG